MTQYFAISNDFNEWYTRIIIRNNGDDITYQDFKIKILKVVQDYYKKNEAPTFDQIASKLVKENKNFERVRIRINMEAHVDDNGYVVGEEEVIPPTIDFEERGMNYALYRVTKSDVKKISDNGYIPRG